MIYVAGGKNNAKKKDNFIYRHVGPPTIIVLRNIYVLYIVYIHVKFNWWRRRRLDTAARPLFTASLPQHFSPPLSLWFRTRLAENNRIKIATNWTPEEFIKRTRTFPPPGIIFIYGPHNIIRRRKQSNFVRVHSESKDVSACSRGMGK